MQSSSPSIDLTPKHVRAARALLAWSQQDLAKSAGVATSTVADFERGHRTPMPNNIQAMRAALEAARIRFLPTGAVVGPSIPNIVPSERPSLPVRWVSAEDLAAWANRIDGVASLPTLLAHLIRATHGSAINLRFPSEEGIRHPGWDGWTLADQASLYVPQGGAGWEIGNQRDGIAGKASDDYAKRTAKPGPLDPASSTYIFVTPRHWPQKHDWIKARRAEGAWRDVRVYDADDLVHWIELTPAVGQWLKTHLGKEPTGTRQIEEVWKEWSRATRWPLTEELVLSDRDEDAAEILRWLRREPTVLSIQATTTEEAIAFLHATLTMLPSEPAARYRARCLAVTGAAARALADAPAPLILVLTEPDPGLARSLNERGHYVLQAYDDRPMARGDVRKLARPSRDGIAGALKDMGIPEPRARSLARDSFRNLAILRRLIPSAPGRLPAWAEEPPPKALLAALLVGAWDDEIEADRAKVAELAGDPYDRVTGMIARYVGDFDQPLRKVGSAWRVASPPDAWALLARHLTGADVERFERMADEVLGSLDPRFKMDPKDRWAASIHGVEPEYSPFLRYGIGESLILLALQGSEIRTVPDAHRRAGAIVRKLLQGADAQRWWSLSRNFRLLAEASPTEFLSAIEDSLDQNDPPIRALFGTDDGGVFGTEHLSDLLWALETLAWSPELLSRVSLVLARLDAIDNAPSRYRNRPGNTLREIYLLWRPQTFAPLDARLRVLKLMRKKEPAAAWKLMLALLPRSHDTAMPTATPRWRDFTVDDQETATWAVIGRGANAITEWLLDDVGLDILRWIELIDRLMNLAPDREEAIKRLKAAEPKIKDAKDRLALRDRLRKLLHHHRQFHEADWAMPGPDLDLLATIYERLAPSDRVERVAWLFEQAPVLPNPSHEGWEAEGRQLDEMRRQAVGEVYAERGAAGILDLARRVTTPGYIGKALFEVGVDDAGLDALLQTSLRSDHQRERDVGYGLVIAAFQERKEPWGERLIAKAREEDWGDTATLTILRAMPQGRWTWAQAAGAGERIEGAYWQTTPAFWVSDDADEIGYAVRKLIAAGRARQALHLAARDRNEKLPSPLLVELLTEAANQPFEGDADHNEPTMFQYYVAEILKHLDERPDVSSDTMVTLEWSYLPVLEYSGRPPKALPKALSEQPELFVQVLKAVFKPTEESGVMEPEPDDPERAEGIAHQAYRLLDLWERIPGTGDDGTIDTAALEAWIKQARSLAKAAGREEIADHQIGKLLAASPDGADGVWPTEAVREAIDLFRSKPMIEGFWIGKSNRRGVTSRLPGAGGELERQEVARYKGYAEALVYDYPHTAKALATLAESYELDARRQDEEAERRDWGA